MALDLWSHQFCLACDRQVESDSEAYCSEGCRLTELERTSSPVSQQSSSPGPSTPSSPWAAPSRQSSPRADKFFLPPAYDFHNAQPYGTTPVQRSLFGNYTFGTRDTTTRSASYFSHDMLASSSSHSSLSSMGSTSTGSDASQLSDRARQELKAYAVSFDYVRTQRRRSY